MTGKRREEEQSGLSGAGLKVIASVAMLIDHVGAGVLAAVMIASGIYSFSPEITSQPIVWVYAISRLIGRIAFPIYAFLIVQGVMYTRDWRKYLLRLSLFAILSEVPFDLLFYNTNWYPGYQNIYFTLALGVLALGLIRTYDPHWIVQVLVIALCSWTAEWIHADYGYWGVLAICAYWYARNSRILTAVAPFFGLGYAYTLGNAASFLSIPIVILYNGEKGRLPQLFFYLFYPGHLLLLYLIKQLVAFGG